MTQSVLDNLALWQLLLLGFCFLWSGLVRSGLGFGGAALSLPLMLIFVDDPLLFLPSIGMQLLFFSLLTLSRRTSNINWKFIGKTCALLFVPFSAGLLGLFNLPGTVLSMLVYIVTLVYGIGYAVDKQFISTSRWADMGFLSVGGYVSGVSLIGAPLIVAVGSRHLPAHQMRDSFFVLWIITVVFKLGAMLAANVDMQWRLTALTFPMVAVGHFIGLKIHSRIVAGSQSSFRKFIGWGLIAVSLFGVVSAIMALA